MSIGLPPIIHFGSDEMKSRVIPECLAGRKVICLAITEPHAGSDVANLRCEAREAPDGEHYIVNGEKKWISKHFVAVADREGFLSSKWGVC